MRRHLTASLRAATFLVVLGACADAREDIAGIPPGAADGLYPQVVVGGTASSTTQVSVSLLRKPSGLRLGSYQGELTYDPAVLRFERANLPEGVDGVAAVTSPGHIRFVGAALDGLGEVPLVTLRFARTGSVKPASFGTVFEEVTAASDLADLTAQVQGGAPLVRLTDR
jgi:hypothetical protein